MQEQKGGCHKQADNSAPPRAKPTARASSSTSSSSNQKSTLSSTPLNAIDESARKGTTKRPEDLQLKSSPAPQRKISKGSSEAWMSAPNTQSPSTSARAMASGVPGPSPPSLKPSRSVKRSSRHPPNDRIMEFTPIKKPRTGVSPPRRVEMPSSTPGLLAPIGGSDSREGPLSPLFFSHGGTPRFINRPVSFNSHEAVASMLSATNEQASVKTLKLPRANVSAIPAPRSGSTPGSWGSSADVSAPSLSTDTRPLPPGLQMLHGVGVVELLEQDLRPTFLIDLGNSANNSRPALHILYYNTALRSSPEVLQLLSVSHDDSTPTTEFGRFKLWIMSSIKNTEGMDLPMPPHQYGGMTWTCSTLRRRFRFVSGNAQFTHVVPGSPSSADTKSAVPEHSPAMSPSRPPSPFGDSGDAVDYFSGTSRKHSLDEDMPGSAPVGSLDISMTEAGGSDRKHPDDFTNEVLSAQPTRPTFDWTKISLVDDLPKHIAFAKSVDWAATALGPMSEWTADLRMLANLVMGSPHPACVYWGPQFVTIYNEAYIELAGKKHPQLMGQLYSEAWAEIWEEIKPVFESAMESGQATMKHENQLFINRNGFLEESFFSWSIVPIVGSEGNVIGLYNPAFENTRRRINERRMLTLREVGERTATATSVAEFWSQVEKGLEYNEWDVPFALIYSVKDDLESEVSSLHSGSHVHPPQLVLEGSLGVPDDHFLANAEVDLRTSMEGFAPYMRRSLSAGGSLIVLSNDDGTLPPYLTSDLDWRGFGDPCTKMVIMPVVPITGGDSVTGFIVVGVNPRRPYDDDYKLFIHLLSRQLATSLASVVLFEEEIKRGQRAAKLAALDRQELSMQLVLTTQQATESEFRFTRMAEFAPVGMFIAGPEGHINWCNDMWWQISRHTRTENSQGTWLDSVKVEDRPSLEQSWRKLVEQKVTISVEFRFKCSQTNGAKEIDTWVIMSAFPEKTQDGSLKSIFGCITDISTQKWAEKVQNERREEAVEMKRQQENFIDITSHEMRNPLSAILQCADQIANGISSFPEHRNKEQVDLLLENCLDAANTINLCASHQKRIVDDILTLSKLDSNLLAVTPVDEQPVRVVQRALKMFESELTAHDIEFEFCVDQSFERHGIKWLKLDPSRLRQVLINLMTNAVKFTQGCEKRSIVVTLSASTDIKELLKRGTVYFPRNDVRPDIQRMSGMDIENEADWGNGERVYIHCSVEDSGTGLGDEEMKVLFQRFRQATPRTHVQYGGSGLGLFISRILTEMQGGQIGVASRKGAGSKFSFYIQSRRCVDPPLKYEHIAPYKLFRKAQSPMTPNSGVPRSPADRRQSSVGAKENPLFDVLIVEDNIVNQKVLQRQLRNAGNNTFVANHGKEALQTIEKSRFWAGKEEEGVDISVILMDLEMPVMDGMTCAKRIRELEREGTIVQHIPIIAVTAYARPEQIEDAKAAGIVSEPDRKRNDLLFSKLTHFPRTTLYRNHSVFQSSYLKSKSW